MFWVLCYFFPSKIKFCCSGYDFTLDFFVVISSTLEPGIIFSFTFATRSYCPDTVLPTGAPWPSNTKWRLGYCSILADLNSTDQDLFINPAYEIHLRNSAVNVQPPRSEIHLVHCGLWTSLCVKSPLDKSGILWHPGLSGLRLEESLNRGRCIMSIYLVKQIKYFPNPQWTEAKVTFTLFCST